MKVDPAALKTKFTQIAGWVKHQPLALLIPAALFVAIALAAGFHRYVSRSKRAEAKVVAAEQSGAADDSGLIPAPLAGLASMPTGLAAGAAQQAVTCPGGATTTTTLATVAAVFTAPVDARAGCTIAWRFYSQAEKSDAGFGGVQTMKNGALVIVPTGEIIGVIASGSPAAAITVTIDGGNTINLTHRAGADLASANGAAAGVGWHEYTVTASIIGNAGSGTPSPLTVRLTGGASPAIPYWTAAGANPHIAQQPGAITAAPNAVATSTAAPVAHAPSIQPPEGVAAGWITRKAFSRDQFGSLALVSTVAEKSSTLTVTAPTRAGNAPAQRVEWSGWIKLDQPASVAMLRLAGGQGTVVASVGGMPLGRPVERWPQSAAAQQTASVLLSPGWHQFAIVDDEQAGTWGDGASIQIAIGDGSTDPQPPVPWAVPPAASAPVANHHIAQHAASASAPASATSAPSESPISRNTSSVPVAANAAGGAK